MTSATSTDSAQEKTALVPRGCTDSNEVSIGTMHLAKGLEFRAVAVMACDDEVVPLQQRIDEVADDLYAAGLHGLPRAGQKVLTQLSVT